MTIMDSSGGLSRNAGRPRFGYGEWFPFRDRAAGLIRICLSLSILREPGPAAAAPLLDHMGEFVSQELPTGACRWSRSATGEENVLAHRVSECASA
ncbi:MAG TPA: hypothetical protein VHO07_14625 [Streptosporangiaceae bacterium]|nr:hypothetical protein [Streptosporangiaceae bacterium]